MPKDAYWFPHDSNARHDPRLVRLRMKHGLEGIGFFWCCIEFLRDQENYEATREEFETLEFSVCSPDGVMATMESLGLLTESDGFIYSESLKNRMFEWDERKRKLSEAGKRGGRPSKPKKKGGFNQAKAGQKGGQSNNRTGHNITEEKKTPKPPSGDDLAFEEFWRVYPNKAAKMTARKAFDKARKNGLPDSATLVAIVRKQNEQRTALEATGAFVPGPTNPATWLNGGRWMDELPNISQKPVYGVSQSDAGAEWAKVLEVVHGRLKFDEAGLSDKTLRVLRKTKRISVLKSEPEKSLPFSERAFMDAYLTEPNNSGETAHRKEIV